MPLSSGTRLGPYQIVGSLGAGGMGEVYRARDTRLNRDVAIKILPASYARETDRLQRFEQEARTVAALNHPNILALYDIGAVDGSPYLVSELLEGTTLREQLVNGPLPVRKAIDYAVQIAQGLAAAHEKGIVHRDLKPDNIFITKDSRVKILDFGLAKLARPEALAAAAGAVDSAAMTLSPTSAGVVVGTTGYMSPEQVRGQTVDPRSDIFNFGLVLYEMLAGRRAFRGDTSIETMNAILKEDPPALSATSGQVPPAVERIVWRCLEKQPEQRFHSAKDLGFALEAVAGKSSPSDPATLPAGGVLSMVARRNRLLWALASLAIAAVTGFAVWKLKPLPSPPPKPVSRFVLSLPPGQSPANLDASAIAFSPDGTRLAYVATQGGVQQLFLREMASLEARPIPGSERAQGPFFSPDSQWVGFFADGKIKKVSVGGGAAVTLSDVAFSAIYNGSWGPDDTIIFALVGGLYKVSAAGGTPRPLSVREPQKVVLLPEILPGGKAVLLAEGLIPNQQVAIFVPQTGERRDLIGGTSPRYAPTGHLIYAQAGTLMAIPFDPRHPGVNGSPVPVLEGVTQARSSGAAQYSFSQTGSLAYVPARLPSIQSRLVWVSRNGAEQPVAASAHAYRQPLLSPDGRRVAVTIDDQGSQVWLYDLFRETLTRFTFEGNRNTDPAWTPDGKWIAFESNKEGPQNLYWQLADGSGGLERLTSSDDLQYPMSWSPDGQTLAFVNRTRATGRDIWVLRLSDRKAQPFLRTPPDETAPQFSPDGRWLAYASDESGRSEIYVQPYPGPGGKWQVSTEGGAEPVWNRSGRELFYRSGDKMMAVDIATQPGFVAGKPRVLFEGKYQPAPQTFPNYDVTPDGRRFLMLKSSESEQAVAQINVVLNWFEELKQRVPTGKK